MLLWITDVLNIACTQVVFTIKTHGYAVRDKRSYLPQLKIVIHTDTNYEISQHVINKSLKNK